MVDRPEEVESFVLLEDEESFEVFDEFENLDLRLFDGDGGGMWRGKGEPGQSITFTFFLQNFHFLSLCIKPPGLNITKIYKG